MIKLSDDVRATHGRDGAVILDIRHGQMFRLNLVGSRILELLSQGYSEEEIAAQVSQQFNVDHETVAADLHDFLAHLEKHRLIETTTSPSPT